MGHLEDEKARKAKQDEKNRLRALKQSTKRKLKEEEVIEEVKDEGPKVHTVAKYRGELDFKQVTEEVGYLKARQKLKQAQIMVHQNHIADIDAKLKDSKQPARLKQAVKLSNTLGMPSMESAQDKIMERSRISANVQLRYPEQPQEEANGEFAMDIAMRKAMIIEDHTLLLPEMHLTKFPLGMGDTLFLQLSFLTNISMPHNKLQSLLNTDLPQLSLYHLRYIKNINLSGNMVTSLPPDFGSLVNLETLDLSYNQMNNVPGSMSRLKKLTTLNFQNNNFTTLTDELSMLDSCTYLNMSQNLLTAIPPPVVHMINLKTLLLNRNSISHCGVHPRQMTNEDLWKDFISEENGKNMFLNVLTKEKVEFVEGYDGKGIERMKALHTFQPPKSKHYAKRKFWLSVCGIREWDAEEDELCQIYYKNNVSGLTMWDMPIEVDLLGLSPSLTCLEISENVIKNMAPSTIKLTKLERLCMFENKLKELPPRLGELENLDFLDLHNNDLKLLPRSFSDLSKVTKLRLAGNQLIRLPDQLGLLPNLEILDVTSNRLATLPFTLGFCKSLKELHVQENPLVDPPIDETVKGLVSFQWYLRQRLHISDTGAPPVMQYHKLSICDEVLVLEPEFNERVNSAINIAKDYSTESAGNGYLNLQLMGLKDLPAAVGRAGKAIRKLRLDYNDKLAITVFPSDMSALRMLSLKGCKMVSLPETINQLKRVSQMSLNDNYFEILPKTFTKLRSLTLLDLTNNRLYDLPEGISGLVNIKTLILEGNNLEYLHPSMNNMSVMQVLDVSKNRIIDIPDTFCDFLMLKKANFERNAICNIPQRINQLSLIELRIGHNNLQALPEDMFQGNLGATIKKFSCCENNLLELPPSLALIDAEAFLEPDFNPYISPPQYILAEGLHTVQLYLRIRDMRLVELIELLEDEDFDFDSEASFPTASEVLLDGTGYLTPLDLSEFDRAVHEYLNAEYFKCPSSGVELVMRLTKLREYRETEIYLTILETLNKVCANLFVDKKLSKLYSDAVLIKGERPWGINGSMCNVTIISLSALLKYTPENKIHRHGRDSIFSLVEKEMPMMPFPFTVDLLKDALRLYMSPYGQVADTEQVVFPSCDCVGGPKNKPQRHDPCKKPSVVLAISVYTEEEADRRAVEDDEFYQKFDEISEDVKIYLSSESGMKLHEKEVKKREIMLYEDVELRDDIKTGEIIKIRGVREVILSAERRKKAFEEGEEFANHGFKSISEPIAIINEQQEKLNKLQLRIDALQLQIDSLNAQLSVSWGGKMNLAASDIIQKYCVMAYMRAVKRFRIYASVMKVRRPWDGEDGAIFADWMKKFSTKYSSDTMKIEELEAMMAADEAAYQAAKEAELLEAAQLGHSLEEFDWDGTDDMAKYSTSLYDRYKDSKDIMGSMMAAFGNAAGFFGGLLGKK